MMTGSLHCGQYRYQIGFLLEKMLGMTFGDASSISYFRLAIISEDKNY